MNKNERSDSYWQLTNFVFFPCLAWLFSVNILKDEGMFWGVVSAVLAIILSALILGGKIIICKIRNFVYFLLCQIPLSIAVFDLVMNDNYFWSFILGLVYLFMETFLFYKVVFPEWVKD
tara:strand:+ start:1837 stop:2193 length:357 start_codon:yes stop_codon:yes gene_type:complete